MHPAHPRSTLATPRSATTAHPKRHKANTSTAAATPRGATAAGRSDRPASGRSASGRQLHIHTPLTTDTAIYKGAIALSPIPTRHSPPTPHDGKYDDDDDDDENSQRDEYDEQLTAQLEASRNESRARSAAQKAKADALSAADAARRGQLEAAFQAAQKQRARQVRADDAYYASMLQRQYERRVKMDFFQQRFEQHRLAQRLADGTASSTELSTRPAFVDFGGRNTRPAVDGERLLSFNITPDLPPNAPPRAQSYKSARGAAVERLRQKRLVVGRVREQLQAAGVEAAGGDGQSEYDRRVASLAQRQRVQQQQQHHAQRMAAVTHKPQRSSRPSADERSATVAGSRSGSAYKPLLPLPIEQMPSAAQSSYASFRPPSAQSRRAQRQH